MVGFLTLVGKGMLDYKIGQREREWESAAELMKFKREQAGKIDIAKIKQDLKNVQSAREKSVNLIPSLNISRYDMINGVKTENPLWKFGNFEVNPSLPEKERIKEGLNKYDATIFNNKEYTDQFLNMYTNDENFSKALKSKLVNFAASNDLLNIKFDDTDKTSVISADDYSTIMPGLFNLEHFNTWYKDDMWDEGLLKLLGPNYNKHYSLESSISGVNEETGNTRIEKTYSKNDKTMPPSKNTARWDNKNTPLFNVVPIPDERYVGKQYIDPHTSIDYNRKNGLAFIENAIYEVGPDGKKIDKLLNNDTTPENIINEAVRFLPSHDSYKKVDRITKTKHYPPVYDKNKDPSTTDKTKGSQVYTGGTEVMLLRNSVMSAVINLEKTGAPTGGVVKDAFTVFKGATGTGGQLDQLVALADRFTDNVWSGATFMDGKGNTIQGEIDPTKSAYVEDIKKRHKRHQADIKQHLRDAAIHKANNRQKEYETSMNLAQLKTMQTILAYRLAVIVQGGEGGRTVSDADFAKALEMVGAADAWTTTDFIKGRLKSVGAYAQVAIVQGYAMQKFGGSYRYRQGQQFFTDLANKLAQRYNPHITIKGISKPISWWNPIEMDSQLGTVESKALDLKFQGPFQDKKRNLKFPLAEDKETKGNKPVTGGGGGFNE